MLKPPAFFILLVTDKKNVITMPMVAIQRPCWMMIVQIKTKWRWIDESTV